MSRHRWGPWFRVALGDYSAPEHLRRRCSSCGKLQRKTWWRRAVFVVNYEREWER